MSEKNKKEKRKKKLSPVVESIVETWETAEENDVFDVLGSYTGNPSDGERPIQDADDL